MIAPPTTQILVSSSDAKVSVLVDICIAKPQSRGRAGSKIMFEIMPSRAACYLCCPTLCNTCNPPLPGLPESLYIAAGCPDSTPPCHFFSSLAVQSRVSSWRRCRAEQSSLAPRNACTFQRYRRSSSQAASGSGTPGANMNSTIYVHHCLPEYLLEHLPT